MNLIHFFTFIGCPQSWAPCWRTFLCLFNFICNFNFQSEIIYALVPWELENIPKYLECLFKKIDTVLAPSTFIQKVISKIHNDVKLLPHYVDINCKISSKKFETFTFTFSADMNSFVERKNPICAINAFIKFLKKKENGY